VSENCFPVESFQITSSISMPCSCAISYIDKTLFSLG